MQTAYEIFDVVVHRRIIIILFGIHWTFCIYRERETQNKIVRLLYAK